MAISYIGTIEGGANITSVTIPAHVSGDLIIMVANRSTTTAITIPAGWTTLTNDTSLGYINAVCYRFATTSGTTSGTWTGVSRLNCYVYRGVASIGGYTYGNAFISSAIRKYQALTMTVTDGTSWVLKDMVHSSVAFVGAPTTPTGIASRVSTARSRLYDGVSPSGTSSYTAENITSTTSANTDGSYSMELVATGGGGGGTTGQTKANISGTNTAKPIKAHNGSGFTTKPLKRNIAGTWVVTPY